MDRTTRFAPLTGLGAVVLLLVAAALVGSYEYVPAAETIQGHYTDNATRILFGSFVGVAAAFLLVWFSGSVRVALRAAEGGDGRLSAVAFGGGVVAAVSLAVAHGAVQAAAARAGSDSGITPDAAATLNDLSGTMYTAGMAMGLSVMIAAFAIVTLRSRFMPKWTAWVGIVIALGGLTIAFIFLIPQVLWVVAVSVALYRREAAASGSAPFQSPS
jgi:hypothetical protein